MTNKNLLAMSVMLFLVYAALLPPILTNYNYGRAYSDQEKYYYPIILYLSQHFTLSNIVYPTADTLGFVPPASTPGYYLLLAAAHKWLSSAEVALKLVNSLSTVAFFLLVARILSDKFDVLRVVVFCLPALCSLYIYPSGVWLLPDNSSWFLIAAILYIIFASSRGIKNYLATAVLLAMAVFVRQTNIWLVLPIIVAGMDFSSTCGARKCFAVSPCISSAAKLLPPVLAIVPALGILIVFFVAWGGFVPPALQERHQGVNFAVPSFFLSLFFVFTIFYLPYLWPQLKRLSRRQIHMVIGAFLFGLLLALFSHTDYNFVQGRNSGLWNFVKITPAYVHRSFLIAILSPLGAATMAIWLLLVDKHARWILLTSVVGFLLVNMANKLSYERFYDGFIFIFLVLCLTPKVSTHILGK